MNILDKIMGLLPKRIDEERLARLSNLLEKYDNVMLGKPSNVRVKVGDKVYGRRKKGTAHIRLGIEDSSVESCVTAKALNLHELGHALFSRMPRTRMSSKENQAYNVLEDQRIEWVLANRYPGMRKYFTHLAKNVLDEKRPELRACMEWGRRFFLPYQVNEPPTENIKRIIDEYLVSKNQRQREDLARQFLVEIDNLLNEGEKLPDYLPPQNYKGDSGDSKDEKQSRKDAQNKMDKEQEEKEKKEEQEKEQKEQEKEEPQEQEQQEKKDEKQEQQNAGTGDTGEEEKESGPGETMEGEGDLNPEEANLQAELSTAMSEVAKELGIDTKEGAPGQGLFNTGQKPLENVNYRLDPKLLEEIYQIFRKVNLELQGTWNRNQKRGRIDLRTAMRGSQTYNPRIFKKYEQSKLQDNKISLVMMYDTSGSMKSNDRDRIEKKAVATLTAAATKASNEVCCIEFEDSARVTKGFNSTELMMGDYRGGTYPEYALKQFESVRKLARYNIVLILLSDGDFFENLRERLGDRIKLYKIKIGHENPRYVQGKNWLQMPDIKELPGLLKGIMTEVETEIKEKLLVGR